MSSGTRVEKDSLGAIERLRECTPHLCEVNLAATAIGTGITAPPGYADAAFLHLRRATGLPITGAVDLIEATSDTGVFMLFSSILKRSRIKLSEEGPNDRIAPGP